MKHSIEVDGEDVSRAVRSATVYLDAGQPSEVTLDLALPVIEVLGAEAAIQVNDCARELLIKAGWTPPVEE